MACFAVLADLPGTTLVNLQFGERAPQAWGALEPGDLETDGQSFEHTAALITHLDLVITCDSVVGHLAGALGKPVWVALPHTPDWRWLMGREDSPWYPSARLFRQIELDNWQEVFERIKSALLHQ
jgi:ADP-heptose:LPS heptosyltransferase